MKSKSVVVLFTITLIIAISAYVYLSQNRDTGNFVIVPEKSIKVASFNVQVFGKAKIDNSTISGDVARIVRQFDIVLIEEIRDSGETVAPTLLSQINSLPGAKYDYIISPRLGRTTSKEQYAYFYNTQTIGLIDGSEHVYDDVGDKFEREPYIASFKCLQGKFDFTLVGIHTKPEDATSEIGQLATVVQKTLSANPNEKDVIVLGDFNADGTYFNEKDSSNPLKAQVYDWVITNDMDTMVKTNWTYDRIVMTDNAFRSEYAKGSGNVFYYNTTLGISDRALLSAISDHFPVYATFDATIDDG